MALAGCPSGATPPPAPSTRVCAALREPALTLPGDPQRPERPQVTLFTPLGPGPFPLAVMNRGADQASAGNRGERYRLPPATPPRHPWRRCCKLDPDDEGADAVTLEKRRPDREHRTIRIELKVTASR